MENNKQEILSKLYAIRAGLSTISLEKDKLYKSEEDVRNISQKMEICKRNIELESKLIESYEGYIVEAQGDIIQTNVQKKENDLMKPSIVKMVIESILISLAAVVAAIIPLFVIAFIIDLIVGFFIGKDVMEYEHIIIAEIIVFIVAFSISFFPRSKEYNRIKQFDEKKYERELNKHNNRIISYKQNINERNCFKNKLESEYEKYNSEYKKAINIYENTKEQVTLTVQTLFDYMMEEFNDFLDYRDWQNVDLIIFYIETRRAETIKEALYQVDRQNQADTIAMACNEISVSIRNLSSSMMITINNCFSHLENRISEQYKSQTKMFKDINNSLNLELDSMKSNVAEHIKSITSQQSIQNALISKIEVNTNELAEDMRYVLNYRK